MRIVIELLELVPGRTGGMETYVRNLVASLAAVGPEHDYLLLMGSVAREGFDTAGGRLELLVPDANAPPMVRRNRFLLSLWQWLRLRRPLREWQPQVYHSTMNFARPIWGAPNLVLTVHDVLFETHPQYFRPRDGWLCRRLCRTSVRLARRVIADSEHTRRGLLERYRLREDVVEVVYPGVDLSLFRPAEEAPALTGSERVKLPEGFLFYPANAAPHKNHLGLIAALKILQERYRLTPPLVLTGAPWQTHPELLAAIEQLGGHQVHWLGYVTADRLLDCYQRAAALVFPSLHEGFGLPVLEAMAAGCPVVCSRTTATGEVAGDAALTFEPTNQEEMADRIHRVLTESSLRPELRQRGRERAAGFSWERTARQTLGVYEKVSSGGRL